MQGACAARVGLTRVSGRIGGIRGRVRSRICSRIRGRIRRRCKLTLRILLFAVLPVCDPVFVGAGAARLAVIRGRREMRACDCAAINIHTEQTEHEKQHPEINVYRFFVKQGAHLGTGREATGSL